jgi:hypothetical protein
MMIEITLLLILYLVVSPAPAHAYLDPGTGSYITQIVIGFLVGGLYMSKIYWHQLKSLLTNLFTRKKKNDPEAKN